MTRNEAEMEITEFLNGEDYDVEFFYILESEEEKWDVPLSKSWSSTEGFSDNFSEGYENLIGNENSKVEKVSVWRYLKAIDHPDYSAHYFDFNSSEPSSSILFSECVKLFKGETLRRIENSIWKVKERNYWRNYKWEPLGRVLDDLMTPIRKEAFGKKITAKEYKVRMYSLKGLMSELEYGFRTDQAENPKRFEGDDSFWDHRNENCILGLVKDENYKVDLEELESAWENYIQKPFLHHPKLDYCFLDVLIYTEFKRFRDQYASGQIEDDKRRMKLWEEVEGDIVEFRRRVDWYLAKNGVMYWILIPLAIIFVGHYLGPDELGGWLWAGYGIAVVMKFVTALWRRKHKAKIISSSKTRLLMLGRLYQKMDSEVIDLRHLEYVSNKFSTEIVGDYDYMGIYLPPIFHAILTKAIKMNPDGILFLNDNE